MGLEGEIAKSVIESQFEEDKGCECECSQKTWPSILCGLGIGVAGFVILVSVLTLMRLPTIVDFILDVYCILLALLSLCAEMRRFKIIRGLMYRVVKYVYFLTAYTGRALFYIFLGTICFDTASLLNMICTGYCCTVALIMIFINLKYKLPVYIDPQRIKEIQEARLRAEADAQYAAANQVKDNATAAAYDTAATGQAYANSAAASAQNYSYGGNSNNSQNAYGGFDQNGSGSAAPYSPPHMRP